MEIDRTGFDCPPFLNFVTSRQCVYEKLEKQSFESFRGRPWKLLVRHSSSQSEMLDVLCHVIVGTVEHQVLLSSRHGDFHLRKEDI